MKTDVETRPPYETAGQAAVAEGLLQPEELVSVIVPAYNAEAFLDETLSSIRAQTHRMLEIIVVDDGSTDATARIAERHAAEDPRVQLIRQPNRGVGAARNAGLRIATGRYVAPVDADDLWSPEKIARQVAAMAAAPGRPGLVYTWFALINESGRVVNRRSKPRAEGRVLERMCQGNLTGNASSALMLTEAVRQAGGYDETLHLEGAQGCEDLKLYWRISEHHDFVCVPEYLTGYRIGQANMSNDLLRMLRSFDVVMADCEQRRPDLARAFHEGRIQNLRGLTMRALRGGEFATAAALLAETWRHDRSAFFVCLARLPAHFLRIGAVAVAMAVKSRFLGPPKTFLPPKV